MGKIPSQSENVHVSLDLINGWLKCIWTTSFPMRCSAKVPPKATTGFPSERWREYRDVARVRGQQYERSLRADSGLAETRDSNQNSSLGGACS